MGEREFNHKLFIRRILLILLDTICIIFAAFFALATRFEFVMQSIDPLFIKELTKYLPVFVLTTLLVFMLFRIYSSLWEYAGIEEIFNIVIACVISGLAQLGIIIITGGFLPRSYYILVTIYLVIFIVGARCFCSREAICPMLLTKLYPLFQHF